MAGRGPVPLGYAFAMDRARILDLYDAEVRAAPVARTGFAIEHEDGLVCVSGPFRFVSSWRLAGRDLDAVVAAVVERSRRGGVPLIWRVFEHDEPAGLATCLLRHGFVAEAPGALMIFDLERSLEGGEVAADVRRAATPEDVDHYLAVSDAVFGGGDAARLKATYDALLGDPTFRLFTAYVAGRPVAAARLEAAPGGRFGALFGGGVAAAHRGRGLYRALVRARAEEARGLGLRYLTTEARDTSRPILERMGFAVLARETTWSLPA